MKKVMLIYPPSVLYQRGEDRSQGNVEDSTATSVRACNDLGYASSMLREVSFNTFLKDYQTENKSMEELYEDFKKYNPDALFMSITNATIFKDINIINELKKINNKCIIILKGSIFFNPEDELLNQLDLKNVDYLIGGESDFIVSDLLNSHFYNLIKLESIDGILYNNEDQFVKTNFNNWELDLDSLKFPERSAMNNSLYVRPDTGEMQATITTSRGCAAACVYCLTPKISGTKIRLRSPENIFEELLECYNKHKIKNFFFKSDTFTMDKNWVKDLCVLIMSSELHGKIEWVANSRVNPLEKETLQYMKDAGCWLVAFGFESGNDEILKKMKKGAKLEDNLIAAKYAKEVGLKIFGFYLMGLPWEDRKHIQDTINMMYKIDADFIEVHIATPYYGTELYEIAKEEQLINETVLGRDYFNSPTIGTKYLSIEEVERIKKYTILRYHLRLNYIYRKLLDGMKSIKILKNYMKFGIKLIKKNIRFYK
jgi:radical SAM superfamily enzyme YgiQ (UPF0313 family)